MAIVNSKIGYGLESAEIRLLSLCLSRVVRTAGDARRKVAYQGYLMLGKKKLR